MKFHIVRSNEKIDDILFLYNISLDELKENNKYIKYWNNIPAGTKLNIPVITKNDDLEIMEMEPFIEDYYPSLESVFERNYFNEINKDKINETKPDEEKVQKTSEENKSNEYNETVEDYRENYRYNYPIYYPVYYMPYAYPYYGYKIYK